MLKTQAFPRIARCLTDFSQASNGAGPHVPSPGHVTRFRARPLSDGDRLVASPASNASRGHETGAGAPSSAGTPTSTNRPAVDLTAITTRDDFLLELGEALGGQASVRPVDSIAGALEYIQSTKRGQVLVIDTRDLADVRADVAQAHTQAPHAVVLVFATTESEKQVSAAVKGSNAFAVLPIPIDKRKAGGGGGG